MPTQKKTASNTTPNTPKSGGRGRLGGANNNTNAANSNKKNSIQHHVVTQPCVFNIFLVRFLRLKPNDKGYVDAYIYDFTGNIDFDRYEADGVVLLRDNPEENVGKPKASDPKGYYKETAIVQLPLQKDNPILTPGCATGGIEKKAKHWGTLLVKGLHDTNWKYPDTYERFPWEYGGIDISHTGSEVACLDQVFLNHDIRNIVKTLHGGVMPKTIPEDILDLIFSDRENNDAYEILGIDNPDDVVGGH